MCTVELAADVDGSSKALGLGLGLSLDEACYFQELETPVYKFPHRKLRSVLAAARRLSTLSTVLAGFGRFLPGQLLDKTLRYTV